MDLFPDGYDVCGLVYESSDTDSEKNYAEVSDEDYFSLDETEIKLIYPQTEDEDSWSESSIGPYLSSPSEENEDNKNSSNKGKSRKKPSRSKSTGKPKKKSSHSSKNISMSETSLSKPCQRSNTKGKLQKKGRERLVSFDNKSQELYALKRKRSLSEGDHNPKKLKDIPEISRANSSENIETDISIFEHNIPEDTVHDQPSPTKMRCENDNVSLHEDSAAMSIKNISGTEAKNVSIKENSEALQSVQLSSEEATKMLSEPLSGNFSTKHSSQKNIETELYSPKEASEYSNGSLADDESDHDEEKTSLRSSTSKETSLRKRLRKTLSMKHEKKQTCSNKHASEEQTPDEKSCGNPGTSAESDGTIKNSDGNISKFSGERNRTKNNKFITKRLKCLSEKNRKNYHISKWEKKACRRHKLFRLFKKHGELHKTRKVEMNKETNEESQPVNLSSVHSDAYYIDNCENSINVGAEASIGTDEVITHEENDQSLGRESSEEQSCNISDNNSSTLENFRGTFRRPIVHISYRQPSTDQSSVIPQYINQTSNARWSANQRFAVPRIPLRYIRLHRIPDLLPGVPQSAVQRSRVLHPADQESDNESTEQLEDGESHGVSADDEGSDSAFTDAEGSGNQPLDAEGSGNQPLDAEGSGNQP